MKTKVIWIIIAIALIGVAYIVGNLRSPKVEYVDVIREVETVVIDTVYIEKPIVKWVTKAIHDTVIIEREIEPAAFQVFASTNQELNSEGTAYGSVDVEYLFPPWDEFHIAFDPAPLPTVVKTITVRETASGRSTSFWDKRWVNFTIGLGFGMVMEKYYMDRK